MTGRIEEEANGKSCNGTITTTTTTTNERNKQRRVFRFIFGHLVSWRDDNDDDHGFLDLFYIMKHPPGVWIVAIALSA